MNTAGMPGPIVAGVKVERWKEQANAMGFGPN